MCGNNSGFWACGLRSKVSERGLFAGGQPDQTEVSDKCQFWSLNVDCLQGGMRRRLQDVIAREVSANEELELLSQQCESLESQVQAIKDDLAVTSGERDAANDKLKAAQRSLEDAKVHLCLTHALALNFSFSEGILLGGQF